MIDENGNRRPLKTRGKKWVKKLTGILLKTNIQPDQISILGMVFAVLAAISFYLARQSGFSACFFFAAVFIQLRLLCNMMDGLIAVEGNRKSPLGDMFNEIPDRYEDIVILAAAGYASGHFVLGWVAATLAVLSAYLRAFGASLGTKQYFIGPMAKPHRMFVLTVSCLIELFMQNHGMALTLGLAIIIVGLLITDHRRRVFIARDEKEQ